MARVEIQIEGMTCQHCVGAVTKSLQEVNGVQKAEVSLEKKRAVVECDETTVDRPRLIQAVEEAGYKVI